MSETITDIPREMRDWDCYSHLSEQAHSVICDFADRVEAAFAEYAKINEQQDIDNSQLRAENERLRALVGEMLSHIEELYQCQSPCDRRCLREKESCEFRARRELIVKAREVVK